MADHDHRQISRDSLFLLANVRLAGEFVSHKIKVRNLSAGGMMAEGRLPAIRGARISVDIRNIGWVEGAIAWVQDDRCGIAFDEDIDPMVARASPTVENEARLFKTPLLIDKRRLRKI